MRSTSETLEGGRVRLSVEVGEDEITAEVDSAARRLARTVRVPGFRPGKVPRRVLEARMGGASALRDEAIHGALPDLFERALSDTDLEPITPAEIDITSHAGDGPLTFEAVFEVRPTVSVAGYGGLVVTMPSLEVSEEQVDLQIDRLREQSGELVVADRPATDGDWLTIDLDVAGGGNDGTQVEDFLYELGSSGAGLVQGAAAMSELDEKLRGARPGDMLAFEIVSNANLPAGTAGAGLSTGLSVPVRVLVKDVQRKQLPEPDDEWAAEVSEFAAISELREDLRARIRKVRLVEAQLQLRDRVLNELISLVTEEPPQALVDSELHDQLHRLQHRLESRGLAISQYLEALGESEEGFLSTMREASLRAVKADLALRALADAEAIDVDDEEITDALTRTAEATGVSVDALRKEMDHGGRRAAVRSQQKQAKALRWLLDHVELVDEDGKPFPREELQTDQGLAEEKDVDGGIGEVPGNEELSSSAEEVR
jgi:trigger factor